MSRRHSSIPPWWNDQPSSLAASPRRQAPPPGPPVPLIATRPDPEPAPPPTPPAASTETIAPAPEPAEAPESDPRPPVEPAAERPFTPTGLVVRPRFPAPPAGAPVRAPQRAACGDLRVPTAMTAPAQTPAPAARRRRWLARRAEPLVSRAPVYDANRLHRSLTSYEPVELAEASGFACRFAADYLSWDEDEPARRESALGAYLSGDFGQLGWSGEGRQRVDLVVPGRNVVLASGVVVIEVSARVVSYRRLDTIVPTRSSAPESPPLLAFAASAAPSPEAPGWEAGSCWWTRLAPPVRRHHDGRLVIDLGLDPATAR